MTLAVKTEVSSENYLNHPTFGLLHRACLIENNQELFTSIYPRRYFFLVTTKMTGIKFEVIGRHRASLLVENCLRQLHRTDRYQEYEKLFDLYQQMF